MSDQNNQHPFLTTQDMARVVTAYRQSGLSLKKFARERGIRPSRLHYWVYHKTQDPKLSSSTKESAVGRAAVFQEVKLEVGSPLLQSWAAEVSVARGLNVRFSGMARPDWIGAVVQALQRPC